MRREKITLLTIKARRAAVKNLARRSALIRRRNLKLRG
jgi:hypothetical protein